MGKSDKRKGECKKLGFPQCAKCEVVKCIYPKRIEKFPTNCPMILYPDVLRNAVKKSWFESEARKINLASER